MAFPVSPPNGNITTLAGKQYIYDSTLGTWTGNLTPVTGNLITTGNASITGNISASNVNTINGGQIIGYHTGAIGANTANTGAFTTVTTTGNITTTVSGSIGKIGINTATPKGYLHINAIANGAGSLYITNNDTTGTGKAWIYFEKTDPTLRAGDTQGGIAWNRTLSDGTTIASSGITVNGSTNIVYPYNNMTINAHADIIFSTNRYGYVNATRELMRIQGTTGLVGIGTYNPSANLHVIGNVVGYFEGPIGANTANTGTFTSVTTTSGGELSGYHTGAIGANTANTGTFTSASITNSTAATSISTGALQVTGGVGIGGNVYIGGNLQVTGTTTFINTEVVTASEYATQLIANGGTDSTSTTTGALQVQGGGGITGNLYVGNSINSVGNIGVALVGANLSFDGEIQSGRLMGRYSRYNTTLGTFYNYFKVLNPGLPGRFTTADALQMLYYENTLNAPIDPSVAYGSNYGSKKVGLAFHVGTAADILANAVNNGTTYAGNVNSVIVGYISNGPRILINDYALNDQQANVITYLSTYHRFNGNVGIGVANASVALDVAGQVRGYFTGPIGANTANTGVFTSVTTTSGGQLSGYITGPIGANTANTGVFTSVTTTSGGQLTGYHTGAIGANTANTGTFTTLTVNTSANLGSNANVIITGGSTNNYLKTDGSGNLSWSAVTAVAAAAGANTQVQFNDGGTTTAGATYLQYNKTSGNLVSNSTTTSIGITNGALVIAGGVGIGGNLYVGSNIMPNSNGTQSMGSSTQKWGTIYGLSTTAQYADLAEKYKSDVDYEPGTVVVFGGEFEITTSNTTHDTRVAGVISTDPAYLMNDIEQEGIWLPVALQGRVPCKVVGPVLKGDVLVSSDTNGAATKMVKDFYEPGCIIGKSLEDHNDNSIKTIEIAIGRF